MKKFLFSIWLLLCTFIASAAPIVSLAWDPSPDADVVNYRLYWGPSSGVYDGSRDLGNVTNTVHANIVAGGHYFFVVTAFNAAGAESDPSNELDYQVPVTPPKKLRLVQTLQAAATPFGPWQEVGTLNSLIEQKPSSEFFRVVMEIAPPPIP
jgi:hypothetical protein